MTIIQNVHDVPSVNTVKPTYRLSAVVGRQPLSSVCARKLKHYSWKNGALLHEAKIADSNDTKEKAVRNSLK